MRRTACICIAILSLVILTWGNPGTADAYSYGNANEETVAEAFKLAAGKLAADPSDWEAADAAYREVRSEIDSHFGAPVAQELDAAYAAKDKDRVLQDWKGVLALNLDRRFTYAEQSFAQYSDAKLLLAKARATYETLKPYLAGTAAEAAAADLEAAFDKALEGLGNPGLLGVGKKEPNRELFKQNIQYIHDTIVPLFPINGAAGGEASENPDGSPAPHAPMSETSRTNPVVTIAAIAAVVVAAGLIFWRLRGRKSS